MSDEEARQLAMYIQVCSEIEGDSAAHEDARTNLDRILSDRDSLRAELARTTHYWTPDVAALVAERDSLRAALERMKVLLVSVEGRIATPENTASVLNALFDEVTQALTSSEKEKVDG